MRSRRRSATTSTRPIAYLRSSRPTAVNLAWALDRMREDPSPERAKEIHAEEVERCRRMAEHAVTLLRPGTRALTHCNTGALATGGYGTALGAIRPRLGTKSRRARVGDGDTAAQPGLTAHRLGARPPGHPVRGDRRQRRRVLMEAGRVDMRLHRCRPHCGERRHRQQDRHVRARRARAPSRRARSSSSHRRPRSMPRRRAARRFRSRSAAPAEVSDRFPAFNPAFDITPAELDRRDRHRGGVRRGAPVA